LIFFVYAFLQCLSRIILKSIDDGYNDFFPFCNELLQQHLNDDIIPNNIKPYILLFYEIFSIKNLISNNCIVSFTKMSRFFNLLNEVLNLEINNKFINDKDIYDILNCVILGWSFSSIDNKNNINNNSHHVEEFCSLQNFKISDRFNIQSIITTYSTCNVLEKTEFTYSFDSYITIENNFKLSKKNIKIFLECFFKTIESKHECNICKNSNCRIIKDTSIIFSDLLILKRNIEINNKINNKNCKADVYFLEHFSLELNSDNILNFHLIGFLAEINSDELFVSYVFDSDLKLWFKYSDSNKMIIPDIKIELRKLKFNNIRHAYYVKKDSYYYKSGTYSNLN